MNKTVNKCNKKNKLKGTRQRRSTGMDHSMTKNVFIYLFRSKANYTHTLIYIINIY